MTQTNAQRLADDEFVAIPFPGKDFARVIKVIRSGSEPSLSSDEELIVALNAENAQLRAQLEVAQAAAKAAVSKAEWQAATNTELNQLRAELEAVRRDAERYRWLRENAVSYPERPDELELVAPVKFAEDFRQLTDSAIDAAMNAAQAVKGGAL